ncbi:MAG: hypothetical protein IPK54_08535 [Dokdonella sp.]|uniref:hypothetical protein n=1 Tax=Dokdonella sp. TaxID=2291710 RepID=UPI0025BF44EB|nr:hypothetical protein [Dokdonella sp.]MBK8123581.1 hypothetical protein [Dokdonella sp.]
MLGGAQDSTVGIQITVITVRPNPKRLYIIVVLTNCAAHEPTDQSSLKLAHKRIARNVFAPNQACKRAPLLLLQKASVRRKQGRKIGLARALIIIVGIFDGSRRQAIGSKRRVNGQPIKAHDGSDRVRIGGIEHGPLLRHLRDQCVCGDLICICRTERIHEQCDAHYHTGSHT